nr:MAG TPA: hypothetical protein [Bacteriophage sp.]
MPRKMHRDPVFCRENSYLRTNKPFVIPQL